MYKYFFIIFLFILTSALYAQDIDSKYLKGAVPEVNGKVIFSKTIVPSYTLRDEKLYDLINQWANTIYIKEDKSKNRIVLSDQDKRNIACLGETVLEFGQRLMTLDQAVMTYQLILEIKDGKCHVTIRNIKYLYNTGKEEETLRAEDMITDEHALNKDGTKLQRYHDKFRIHTLDAVNNIYSSIESYLESKTLPSHSQQPVIPTTPPETDSQIEVPETDNQGSLQTLQGYRKIEASQIPENIIELLGQWTLITSGTEDKLNTMTASWGGLGTFWEVPVSFCFLNPTRYSIQTMDEGEVYTISFYTDVYKDILLYCGSNSGRSTDKIKGSGLTPVKTPSGATAFSEAWLIIECKKIVAQPISADAVIDKPLSAEWSKDGYHKIYIGQILNVWIK